jgi:hypothetical protein
MNYAADEAATAAPRKEASSRSARGGVITAREIEAAISRAGAQEGMSG